MTSNGKVPHAAQPPICQASHVAIIMDGNGRWATARGLPRLAGHRAGTENVRRVLQALARGGVRYVTLYAFSTENWGRPAVEVNGLIQLLEAVIDDEVTQLHQQGVRILHLGSKARLPTSLAGAIAQAEERTKQNTGLTLCVAFDYGGRAEVVAAVRAMLAAGLDASHVTEEALRAHLCLPDVPDPDLIVRTGGEQRLSNFLIWQGAYSELYFTPTLWPDFDEAEVERALDAFRQRDRRFGRLPNGADEDAGDEAAPRAHRS
ncbi:MAG: di-trans,poly-cis-decaprenylcistransferase [SAR202 cluster bacterium]|nr:di-trans,poly-cis-decaprenylcistransferase [SAR202 cluster bacterium]